MKKLLLDDLGLRGKRVLARVDFNVPLDEDSNVADDTRIVETLPTIRKILRDGGKAVLMSHLGRPSGKVLDKLKMAPVAVKLEKLLGMPVVYPLNCLAPETEEKVNSLKNGDCALLENLRFHPQEETNDPKFSEKLSKLGDLYVNDAFGTAHRSHASTQGVTKFFSQRAAGYLMAKEIDHLSRILISPQRPFVAVLGGAKISGKIDVIENLLKRVDSLLLGGGMAFTFFRAQGLQTGDSLLEEDKVNLSVEILNRAKKQKVKLLLPSDCLIADGLSEDAQTKVVESNEIPTGWRGLDIGSRTVQEFAEMIKKAKTVFWNGPMGVFEMERFACGTYRIAEAVAEATDRGALTVVGGGDSAAALAKAGVQDRMTHISTGGGASLEFLEGKLLPGVAALSDKD